MTSIEPIEITTGRLVLRPPVAADIPALFQACQDPENQRWTTIPSPYAYSDAEDFVGKRVPAGYENGTDAVFAIFEATGGDLVGTVGLHRITPLENPSGRMGEIGYLTAPDKRGKGYMTEAVRAVSRYAFEALGFVRIEWYAWEGNRASRRVIEKAGYTFEGTLRGRFVVHGRRVDAWVGGLLATDPRP